MANTLLPWRASSIKALARQKHCPKPNRQQSESKGKEFDLAYPSAVLLDHIRLLLHFLPALLAALLAILLR
jgi:hypothetical protein